SPGLHLKIKTPPAVGTKTLTLLSLQSPVGFDDWANRMDYSPPGRSKLKHVERVDLYVNLRKRIEYLHAFLHFTSDDINILNKGNKFLKGAIPVLAHRLNERLLQFDLTARALKLRDSNVQSDDDDPFTINSPHVQRRKVFWKWYLTRLLSDPSRMEYWEYLDKIGRMHRGRILIHPLHIEYLHMNVCLGYLQDLFFEFISTNADYPVDFRFSLIRTMNKLLNVQNDLISRWYVKDGEEFFQDDVENNDSTFTEGATECPFDASELSVDRNSSESSIKNGSISSRSEKEHRHLSYLQKLNDPVTPNSTLARLTEKRFTQNVNEAETSRPSTATSRRSPTSSGCPHMMQSSNESPDFLQPSHPQPSRDQNSTLRHQVPPGRLPPGTPYSGLLGAGGGGFQTKIWSANDTKHKKNLLPRF
ncbi:hypothetical protein KEM54_000378, partial [Ascosphaera aggregata]